jgi:hypothetical protein
MSALDTILRQFHQSSIVYQKLLLKHVYYAIILFPSYFSRCLFSAGSLSKLCSHLLFLLFELHDQIVVPLTLRISDKLQNHHCPSYVIISHIVYLCSLNVFPLDLNFFERTRF